MFHGKLKNEKLYTKKTVNLSCSIGNNGFAELGNKICDMRSLNKLYLSVYE
jgi:hypothetical protein